MTTINTSNFPQMQGITDTRQKTEALEDKVAASAENNINLAYMMVYEQWKTDILLSDGLNEDENAEW